MIRLHQEKHRLCSKLVWQCLSSSFFLWFSGEEDWHAEQRDGSEISVQWISETQEISVISETPFPIYFIAPGI